MRKGNQLNKSEFILKIIKLLKPEFYNKLTWSVVIAGLVLMGTPLWEEIVSSLLNKEYNLNLTPGGNTPWGFALVISGLIYHLISNSLLKFVEYKNKENTESGKHKHDVKIFENSKTILTEKNLNYFLYSLLSDHSYVTKESRELHNYSEYHSTQESEYIDKELRDVSIKMSKAIDSLLSWMSVNFWVYPNKQPVGNMRLCMHPQLNMDREGDGKPEDFIQYDKHTDNLTDLSNNVTNAYTEYRKLVKHKLFI